MVFTSTKKNIADPLDIVIDGCCIDKVNFTKFLGVYIDDKLNWKKHISYISGKVSRGIGIIVKARKLLPLTTLKTLYYSFIYPYFTYCNHVWGTACDTHLKPLVKLQKRCVRIITMSKYKATTDPLFTKLGLLKLHGINKYVISKFMYKWYHDKLPSVFQFIRVSSVHDHSTRQSSHLYCPKLKTALGKRKYTYQAPHLWNQILEARINPEVSEAVFCKSMKQAIKVEFI